MTPRRSLISRSSVLELAHPDNSEQHGFDVNFNKMISDYSTEHHQKVPFIKSDFIYYCKIGPEFEDPETRQYLFTMEKVQKPKNLKYKGVGNRRIDVGDIKRRDSVLKKNDEGESSYGSFESSN